MRDGKAILTEDIESLTMGELVTAMVGEDIDLFPSRQHEIGEKMFEVNNLVVPPVINGLNFSLRSGEVLGIAGIKDQGEQRRHVQSAAWTV
ncbi:MAG: hypothetical protein M5U34_33830 [Chloroflexi bacterium]|nr:hypothetical protein [Chloroflexota bacterium]